MRRRPVQACILGAVALLFPTLVVAGLNEVVLRPSMHAPAPPMMAARSSRRGRSGRGRAAQPDFELMAPRSVEPPLWKQLTVKDRSWNALTAIQDGSPKMWPGRYVQRVRLVPPAPPAAAPMEAVWSTSVASFLWRRSESMEPITAPVARFDGGRVEELVLESVVGEEPPVVDASAVVEAQPAPVPAAAPVPLPVTAPAISEQRIVGSGASSGAPLAPASEPSRPAALSGVESARGNGLETTVEPAHAPSAMGAAAAPSPAAVMAAPAAPSVAHPPAARSEQPSSGAAAPVVAAAAGAAVGAAAASHQSHVPAPAELSHAAEAPALHREISAPASHAATSPPVSQAAAPPPASLPAPGPAPAAVPAPTVARLAATPSPSAPVASSPPSPVPAASLPPANPAPVTHYEPSPARSTGASALAATPAPAASSPATSPAIIAPPPAAATYAPPPAAATYAPSPVAAYAPSVTAPAQSGPLPTVVTAPVRPAPAAFEPAPVRAATTPPPAAPPHARVAEPHAAAAERTRSMAAVTQPAPAAVTPSRPVAAKVETAPKPAAVTKAEVPAKVEAAPKPAVAKVETAPKPLAVTKAEVPAKVEAAPKPAVAKVETAPKPLAVTKAEVPAKVEAAPKPAVAKVETAPKPLVAGKADGAAKTDAPAKAAAKSEAPAKAGRPAQKSARDDVFADDETAPAAAGAAAEKRAHPVKTTATAGAKPAQKLAGAAADGDVAALAAPAAATAPAVKDDSQKAAGRRVAAATGKGKRKVEKAHQDEPAATNTQPEPAGAAAAPVEKTAAPRAKLASSAKTSAPETATPLPVPVPLPPAAPPIESTGGRRPALTQMMLGVQHLQMWRHYQEALGFGVAFRGDSLAAAIRFWIGGSQTLLPEASHPLDGKISGRLHFLEKTLFAVDFIHLAWYPFGGRSTRFFVAGDAGAQFTPDTALRAGAVGGLSMRTGSFDTELYAGYMHLRSSSDYVHAFVAGVQFLFGHALQGKPSRVQADTVLTADLEAAHRRLLRSYHSVPTGNIGVFLAPGEAEVRQIEVAAGHCYAGLAVSRFDAPGLPEGQPVRAELRAAGLLDTDEGSRSRESPLFVKVCPENDTTVELAVRNVGRGPTWVGLAWFDRQIAPAGEGEHRFDGYLAARLAELKAWHAPHGRAPLGAAALVDGVGALGTLLLHRGKIEPGMCQTIIGVAPPGADLDAFTFVSRSAGTWLELIDSDSKPYSETVTRLCNQTDYELEWKTFFALVPDAGSPPATTFQHVRVKVAVVEAAARPQDGPRVGANAAAPPTLTPPIIEAKRRYELAEARADDLAERPETDAGKQLQLQREAEDAKRRLDDLLADEAMLWVLPTGARDAADGSFWLPLRAAEGARLTFRLRADAGAEPPPIIAQYDLPLGGWPRFTAGKPSSLQAVLGAGGYYQIGVPGSPATRKRWALVFQTPSLRALRVACALFDLGNAAADLDACTVRSRAALAPQ